MSEKKYLKYHDQDYWWQCLKHAYHQATFMQGQTTPAAKHLFHAIEKALVATRKEDKNVG